MFARMPQAPTRLKKSRDEARRLLRKRMDEAVEIANDIRSQQELQKAVAREKLWREYNYQLLDTIFTTPEYADEYRASVLPLFLVSDRYGLDPDLETFKSRLVASVTSQIAKLVSILNRLELVEEESAAPRSEQPPDKVGRLVTLAERFHLVALQMRKRRADRPALELKDEYDVQYLFRALMTIDFDDIRPEEGTPSYAGAPAKMDFLLPELETVVELKMTRPSRSTSELRDELLVDIARYQTHAGCRTLFCIVYDPDGRISNPRGFEADLNGEHGDLVVRVMIVPKGT